MSLTISDDLLLTMRMTEDEASQEIAVLFYQKQKLTLAQASRLAGMDRMQFQHLLASRRIPINYDVKDFEEDLKNLRKLRSS